MRPLTDIDFAAGEALAAPGEAVALSSGGRGFGGVIVAVRMPESAGGLAGGEIERRLLEMGFVEGAAVEIIHEGLIGRDPIAVRLADRKVALRRREARSVMVRQTSGPPR